MGTTNATRCMIMQQQHPKITILDVTNAKITFNHIMRNTSGNSVLSQTYNFPAFSTTPAFLDTPHHNYLKEKKKKNLFCLMHLSKNNTGFYVYRYFVLCAVWGKAPLCVFLSTSDA
jgi:hypothetical protein